MLKSYEEALLGLYNKTLEHQKEYHDGTFPFKNYLKLSEYVEKYKVTSALELGTAIGLTAAAIVLGNDYVNLDTMEKHERNIDKARGNVKASGDQVISRINFIEGRYFDLLESDEYKLKRYDLIFLDAYVSRYNEVKFLTDYLNPNGIFIISNLRKEIPKSLTAYNFICDDSVFEVLEEVDDTIFVRKRVFIA
jgi:predicted O-methyltransferase YrrM